MKIVLNSPYTMFFFLYVHTYSKVLCFGGLFWPCMKILVPRPVVEPKFPAVEAQNLNHWTTKLVPYNKV